MMAEKSSFFNSVNGDRKYLAGDFAKYFGEFISNGYFPKANNSLQVIADNGLTVTLKKGSAYINGYMYSLENDLSLTLDVADGILNRIDRIIIRLDFTERNITAQVLKGAVSSAPTPPALTRDADSYDLCVASINIAAGTTNINQTNIIDTRLDTSLCGVVNNLFADAQAAARMVMLSDDLKYYNSVNVEAALAEIRTPLSIYRSGVDANGIYTTYEEKNNSVMVKRSVLSNPNASGNYQTQTISYYNGTGIIVKRTEVYSITYDVDGNPINEVLVSSTISGV